MRTFVLDNEDAVVRYLASLAWTDRFVSISEKQQNERIKKDKQDQVKATFLDTLDAINRNRCRTGKDNPATRKKMIADKFSETVKVVL